MKEHWVHGIAALGFLVLGYLSSTKGDFATAGVFTVLGIVFASNSFSSKGNSK